MAEVAKERSHWRDERISLEHRKWGFDCPAADIDWLVVEYDCAKIRALIEYKHERAMPSYPSNPNNRAIKDLADRAGVPFFAVRYTHDLYWYTMTPLNERAKKYLPVGPEKLSKPEYVAVLYAIRDRRMPVDLREKLQAKP